MRERKREREGRTTTKRVERNESWVCSKKQEPELSKEKDDDGSVSEPSAYRCFALFFSSFRGSPRFGLCRPISSPPPQNSDREDDPMTQMSLRRML